MKKIYALLLSLIMYSAFGQEGTQVPGFQYQGVNSQKISKASNGDLLVLDNNNLVLRINPTTGQTIQTFAVPHSATTLYGQKDGSILVGGNMNFSYTVNGYTHTRILKYSSTGVFDPTFKCTMTGYSEVYVITEQPVTNKILVGTLTESTQAQRIFRLLTNGTVDTFFQGFFSQDLINHYGVMVITTYSDGRILIGGSFLKYQGVARNSIARLGINGQIDANFNVPDLVGTVMAIAIQPDDTILIGGILLHETTGRYHFLKISSTGAVDNAFATAFINPIYSGAAYGINDIKIQSCGSKILISGSTTPKGITRLKNTDGAEDLTFNPGGLGFNDNGGGEMILDSNNNIFMFSGGTYNGLITKPIIKLYGNANLTAVADAITTPAGTTNITVLDVLVNDKYNTAQATINNVRFTPAFNVIIPGITFNANTGKISIAPSTVPGTYTYNYTICAKSEIGIGTECGCKSATATIKVPGVEAVDDLFTTTSNNISFLKNVFDNDTHYGAPANSDNTTLTVLNTVPGITVSTYGTVTISSTPGFTLTPGTYTINYQICSISKPSVCDTGIITVKLLAGKSKMNSHDEGIANSEISIYPNPTEGIFNIDLKGYDESAFDIAVYNALGQLIHNGSITSQNTNQIDLTRFEAGSYFITLQNANETINKIIVKK